MKTADEWYSEGDDLFQKGKFAEAIACFDKVLQLDPKYMAAYRRKFKSLSAQGEDFEVINCCKKALAIDPNYKFAYNALGVSYKRIGEYQKALDAFDKAISIDPTFDFAYSGKGNTLQNMERHEEAIQAYDKAIELAPDYFGTYGNKAESLRQLGRNQEALDLYDKSIRMNPNDTLTLCNKADLLSTLGRSKEALEALRKVQEIHNSGYIDVDLNPGHKLFITETLGMITELDKIEAQTEEVIKQKDTQNPIVKKLVDNMRKLKEEKEKVTVKLITSMDNQNNGDLVKELSRLKEEFQQIKQDLLDVKSDVKQIKSQLEDIKEELNNKMDDFRKKLDRELAKTDLTPEERTKITDYFNAFIETFSSTHVTSQVIDSGQVQIDSDNSQATLLSVIASFTPFIGSTLQSGIKSIGDFLQSQEMKTNARKMKGLASDATRLSQIIGEAAYKIVLDKEKQKQILNITNEDLKRISGTMFEKIFKFCDNLNEQIDCYLYTNLYQSPSARLGHNDANSLIELWLGGQIDPYNIQQDMTQKAISMKDEGPDATSPPLLEGQQPNTANSGFGCNCNMF